MIRIRYKLSEEEFRMKIEGHAQSAEKGEDLICCAVSTLIGTLNAHLGLTCDHFDSQWNGDQIQEMSARGRQAMEDFYVIMTGLRMLAYHYPDYVSVVQVKKL